MAAFGPATGLTGLEWRFVSSQQNEAAMRGAMPDGAGSNAGLGPAAGGNDTGQGDPREPATRDDTREPATGPQTSTPQVSKPGAWRLTGPAGPVKATAVDGLSTGKATTDGKILYRRLTPIVLWWAWLAFVVFSLVDVVIPAHSYLSVEVVAGLLTVTAFVYACAVRPRVIADDESVVIYNPFRNHHLR